MMRLSVFIAALRLLVRPAFGLLGFAAIALACVYAVAGTYGLNVVLHRGGTLWLPVSSNDPRLSSSMQLALRDHTIGAEAGTFAWRTIAPGFDVAELPVIANSGVVDRILLARVDPAHFRFVVRTAPAGNRNLDDWMKLLNAALVINGSYFTRDGAPDTPLVSAGAALGPQTYTAKHGAFVASATSVGVHDLAKEDWRALFRGADDAMVSFPMLVTADGASRVNADWQRLANRSFVGQDRAGRILLGTTTDAFFALDRFADFLAKAPLDLALALNLDGGPVASQGIALNGYHRSYCGQWELAARSGQMRLLASVIGTRCWEMPIVLAVLPK